LINLPFVRDAERYGPLKTEPIVLTQSDGNFGRSPHNPYGLWFSDASIRTHVLSWLEENDIPIEDEGGRRIRLVLSDDSELMREISTLPRVLSMVEYVPPKLFNDIARHLLGVTHLATGHAACR
jgi:serine protease AprX